MAEYAKAHELDYSQGGDTLDEFAVKYMAEMTRVFRFLNELKTNTINNIESVEPSAGQWKVEDGKIYIRNNDNTAWVYLFDVAVHGGLKTDTIGKFSSGDAEDRPQTGSDRDIFFDTQNERMYMWLNGVWVMQSSRNVADLDGYDDLLTTDNIGTTEGKVPAINENGLLPVSITGNAAKIAGINSEVNNLTDGQVLTYRAVSNSWRNEDKGTIGSGKSLAVYDDERLMFEYNGDTQRSFNIGEWHGYDIGIIPTFDNTFKTNGNTTEIYTEGRLVKVIYVDNTSNLTDVVSAEYDSVSDMTTIEVGDDVINVNVRYVSFNPTAEKYAPLDDPIFTGTPKAPTQDSGDNSTNIATTAFVTNAVSTATNPLAPSNSPTFTGTPTAPTAEDNDDSTQIATTKFVNTAIHNAITPKENIIYGFHINSNESDPSTAITYLEDAVGMTPAFMNYYNGFFDYGSWEHAFFMPKPCMLKSDGTVDYYLNPNDYSLKEDGTPSDIANDIYDGNAMMEWGQNGKKIWYKIVPDTLRPNSASVYIANYQADENYKCYSFVDGTNTVKDHFYTAIYNGSNVSSKLRSLSGKTHMVSQTAMTEIAYAQANGTGWNIDVFADRILINLLLILMSKSLDTQKIYGNGHYSGGTGAGSNLQTGLMNAKGMFWGTNGNTGVKVFGMENWWAEVWRRTQGLINDRGTYKYKLTENNYDGSMAITYNTSGDGYLTHETACPSMSNSAISAMVMAHDIMLPQVVSGSTATYYCDCAWSSNSQNNFALFGGNSYHGASGGAFACDGSNAPSSASWGGGACLSYR